MAVGQLAQQWEGLMAASSPADWRFLAALAAEERLGETALGALGCPSGWVARALSAGWLTTSGLVRSLDMRKSGFEEPAYAFVPELRERVLRRAAELGELGASVEATRRLLGLRSVGSLATKLQSGGLRFRPEPAAPPPGARTQIPDLERRTRESITCAFDPAWLERTWGEQAPGIVARVLEQALPRLEISSELSIWAARSNLREGDEKGALASVLVAHALHRAHFTEAEQLATALAAPQRLAFAAVSRLLQGERALALGLLEQSIAFAGGKLPSAGHWTPLLALLVLGDKRPEGAALVKKWLTARSSSTELKGAARALRVLVRYRSEPDARLVRIDAHQLKPETSAWEALILGLTVATYLEQPGTRAAWAEHLEHESRKWAERGYAWPSRQARILASQLRGDADLEPDEPADLSALIEAEAPWERDLSQLEQLAVEVAQPATTFRLEWYVNMVDGSLNKPGLQEFVTGQGWATTDRLSRAEADALTAKLPLEDRRVLGAEHPLEALIGHPRVVNGARGSRAVEVVRGSCQLETADEVGFLTIRVTPPGLGLGVNVRVEGEARLVVIVVSAAMQKLITALPHELRVPLTHAGRALSILGKLSEGVSVKSPHLGGERRVEPQSVPCLRIAPLAGAWLVQAGVRPFGARGRFFVVGTGPHSTVGWSEGQKLRTDRDVEEETRRVHELIAACPSLLSGFLDEDAPRAPGESKESWTFGGDDILGMLSEVRASGLGCEFEWPESTPIRLRGGISTRSLHGNLRSKKGWYLASGSVAIDEVTTLSLAELTTLPSVAAGRFVRLPSGDFVELETRVRRVLAALAGATRSGHELRLSGSHVHALRTLADTPGIGVDESTRDLLARFAAPTAVLDKPVELRANLRPYQEDGFRWLCQLGEWNLGACLADDMGLGKTVQILAFLLTRPAQSRTLIVAPTSVCTNWLRETRRFAPSLDVREYVGSDRAKLLAADGPRVLVASYGLLHEDSERLAAVEWTTVVLDEAQFIKNPASQRARAAFGLRARHRIASTGTPIENHLGDLWSIFRFLNPELLGSWDAFQTFYVKPIEREGNDLVRESLREIVKPYVLRRLKSEVLTDLPPLTTVRHEVSLSREESLRYALLRRQIHIKLRTVAGRQQNKLEILAELTRLRRFCCHPRLVFPDAPQESQKLDAFLELVTELRDNGHRALVFSQYVDFLALVREQLDEAGIGYEYLDGSTPKSKRQERIDAFQTGSDSLFLISLKAGGLGLNLTAADYVIHLDPWWNPAVEAQATDRAHRFGQTRPVTVYQFVTRDTIEEDILELHGTKQRLAGALLEGGERVAGLSALELVDWLEKSTGERLGTGLVL